MSHFLWELWINMVVGTCRSQHILHCWRLFPSSLVLRFSSWYGADETVSTLSCWMDQLERQQIPLSIHPGPSSGTRTPAAAFHRRAGGSGEKFGSTAPPISSALISLPLLGYATPSLVGQSLLKHSPPFRYTSVLSRCPAFSSAPAPN